MSRPATIDISLLGREYRVACAPEEQAALRAAVAHVEAKMNALAARTKGSGERLAVMTALNLAHELLGKQADEPAPAALSPADHEASVPSVAFDSPEITRRINAMVARLDAVLGQQESLL